MNKSGKYTVLLNGKKVKMIELKCCLCGKTFFDFFRGNIPWPIADVEDGGCCDECDIKKVIPARTKMLRHREALLDEKK